MRPRRRRRWPWAVGAVVVPALLLLATFAMPVEVWRTGELPVPPLPVVDGGPAVELAERIWVDTDAACGSGPRTDADDCFALTLLAATSGERVVGVSTVFGNAPLEVTDRTVRELVSTAWPPGEAPPVFRGAASPTAEGAAGDSPSTPAVEAMRRALAEGPLTLLASGPLTNVAAALEGRPQLRHNLRRLVAVMGRRTGHLFHPSEGRGHGLLFGHGPVFTDFNLRQDPEAAARLLAMGLPWSLIPYDVARRVTLTALDLERMRAAGGSARWAAERAAGWLRYWNDEVGLEGFYPFDLLAAAYTVEPGFFDCAPARAWVAPAPRLFGWLYSPVSLLVGLERERPEKARAEGEVVYCPEVDPALAPWLRSALTEAAPARRVGP